MNQRMRLGSIIIDIEGFELTPEDRDLLQHPLVGGVIFFARNYESSQQMPQLCKNIRATRKTPLLITVDQEGGRVQRFKKDFLTLPSMQEIGEVYEQSAQKGLAFAYHYGWLMAAEILAVGIDLSFAPVLDLDKNKNTVVGNRAFHRTCDVVIPLAKAVMRGMSEAGMASTGKHFPGHGSVSIDSHGGLPEDKRTFDEIYNDDMQPFIELIRANISAIMPGHLLFPLVDDKPVGFSHYWLQEILRKKLQFKGVIFTDALDMGAANAGGNFADRTRAALDAGCDLALVCNSRAGAISVLDELPQKYFLSPEKFHMLQGKMSQTMTSLHNSPEWQTHFNSFDQHRKTYANNE